MEELPLISMAPWAAFETSLHQQRRFDVVFGADQLDGQLLLGDGVARMQVRMALAARFTPAA